MILKADYQWSKQPDLRDWLGRTRLNPSLGLMERAADPQVREAWKRFQENVRPGLEQLACEAADPPKGGNVSNRLIKLVYRLDSRPPPIKKE